MNAHEHFLQEKTQELEGQINLHGTKNMGKALARTEWFREVLSFALEERYGRAGASMIMTLIQAGEEPYRKL